MEEKQGNIKVVCRFRPLNQRELAIGSTTIQEIYDDKTLGIKSLQNLNSNSNIGSKADGPKFSFDKVFDSRSTQQQVYNYAASSVIDSVIEGFNGTIFAYGQTASGKTHTMQGEISDKLTSESGIVPRMVKQVFDSIATASEHIQFRIRVSLVELYLQKLRDLIDLKKNDLKIRSDKKKGIYIEDLSETYISSPEEVYAMIKLAQQSRAIAATNMNERSSRSHMLFILTISQNNTEDLSAKTGKLYLVDLAGSEKVGKTGAEGKVLDEAKKINVSLTALGKVINSLTDGKSTHIPYRDSKLTRVLQESLGGNSKTCLIVTCSPHSTNVSETISTLRFGVSAKKIKNKPKINKELTVGELQSLVEKAEREIAQRDRYIEQLKVHIVNDLKQKSAPLFSANGQKPSLLNSEEEQVDLISELERQLQMERNLHIVQEDQISSLKAKCDMLTMQKEDMEKDNQDLKAKETEYLASQEKKSQTASKQTDILTNSNSRSMVVDSEWMAELQKLTSDESILKLVRKNVAVADISGSGVDTNINQVSNAKYEELLEQYETERDRRKKAEDFHNKYEKNMQKKLMQLENNITQLTHAYYDLVVVQQRWKVDNLFLKKTMEEKDVSIHALKEKIKDLQDQNRQLEEQKWVYDDEGGIVKKKNLLEEEFDEEADYGHVANLISGGAVNQHRNVVKVLTGGRK